MTVPWRKALRDVRGEGMRSALVILAVALGIAGFTALLSTYAILTRELDRGYLSTNPASATLRTDAVDDALLREIRTGHGVSDAEARRVVAARIRVGREWLALRLFVVQDYGNIRIGRLQPENGAWPPGKGDMLIERDAFQVARARIGDVVTVRTPRGGEHALRVSGGVHDVGQAQARMENAVYGYVTLATLAELGEDPYLDEIQILAAGDRFDERHVRAVAADVRSVVEGRGHPVRRLDVPKPGRHPHADIMGVLLLSMASFGLCVLVLSGILVINLLTAIMASQVRQIGVMKTVGATRGQVARIFLAEALFLGLTAVCVALPAGVLGGRAFCKAMAVLLNFDITSFAVPAWVFLLVAAVGLLVPLMAAAYPVWRGSGVSVLEALSDFGVSGNVFGASAFERGVARLGGALRPALLGLRNSLRRRGRLILTVATLAAGGLLFMSALNVRASLIHTLDRLFASKKFDLSVGLGGMYPAGKIERAVRATPGIRLAEGWVTTEASREGARAPGSESGGRTAGGPVTAGPHGGAGAPGGERFPVVALPPETRLQRMELVAGRGLRPGDADAMVVNTALATGEPPMRVGDVVPIWMGHGAIPWRVVGIAREPFSPPLAYVPLARLQSLGGFEGRINSLRLALDRTDRPSITRLKASLERSLDREGVHPLGMSSLADSRFGFDQHMLMIYVALVVMSGVVGAVGGLGLMTTMSIAVLERRRELGVLRAIGASPLAVSLIVVVEGVAIGLASWALAAIAAWPVSRGIGSLLARRVFQSGLDFAVEPGGIVVWLVASLLLGAASSFVPAWQSSRRPLREALAYE